jgi:hypothetical protein
MTRKDIIRMARKAGSLIETAQEKDLLWLEAFSKIVAHHEREACAKIVDGNIRFENYLSDLIRARGQA